MNAELKRRRDLLVQGLPAHTADCLLVSSPPNVRYLSGFTGSNALLLVSEGETTLFTDPRYTIRAKQESDCPAVIAKGSLHEAASKRIARRKWRRIGVEQGKITYSAYIDLEKFFPMNSTVIPLPPIVEQQRMVKSDAEVELIRQSVLTNSAAFEKTVARLKVRSRRQFSQAPRRPRKSGQSERPKPSDCPVDVFAVARLPAS